MQIGEFFRTARERESIRRAREAGRPWPWTNDRIFREWRFCNVHRENDKTTIWFRENIRSQHVQRWKIVRATFVFRWFNRIEVGEVIKDMLFDDRLDLDRMHKALRDVKPITTGAYMTKTPDGLNKLDGVLWAIKYSLVELDLMQRLWGASLKDAWKDLCELPYFGPFMAYEIVTDLRHTSILENAVDIMTWANAGPGCARGISRVAGEVFRRHRDQPKMLEIMMALLEASKDLWPENWEPWEMREVEHWACEYHKYCNAKEGKRLKRRYSHELS